MDLHLVVGAIVLSIGMSDDVDCLLPKESALLLELFQEEENCDNCKCFCAVEAPSNNDLSSQVSMDQEQRQGLKAHGNQR